MEGNTTAASFLSSSLVHTCMPASTMELQKALPEALRNLDFDCTLQLQGISRVKAVPSAGLLSGDKEPLDNLQSFRNARLQIDFKSCRAHLHALEHSYD